MDEFAVRVPVSYRKEWTDGFGARGWKLDIALDDPEVIAATAETGQRVPTSVLIHDILDHHLCGLPLSGHRNEAIALHQLSLRTGSNALPDLEQMVDEDLIHGVALGEPWRSFLPEPLDTLLPQHLTDGRVLAGILRGRIGELALRQALIGQLICMGYSFADEACELFRAHGLDPDDRGKLGEALQNLLADIDAEAQSENWGAAHGEFLIGSSRCGFRLDRPAQIFSEVMYDHGKFVLCHSRARGNPDSLIYSGH